MSADAMSRRTIATLVIRTVSLSRGRSPLAPGLPDGITPAEQQLLQLLSDGKSYPDIGAEMCIHRDTVAMRASRVFRKLNVNNAAGAVAAAIRRGIIK